MNTILLADDDKQLRGLFAEALRRKGYRVIEADSGRTALALARQHLPDLILSDIHMPGGDGSTLLRDLRHDPELRSRQIVLMTGRPEMVTPRKGMEEGADDFLVKPVELAALLACVEARFSRASVSWRIEDEMLAKLRAWVPPQLPHEFFTPLAGIIGLMEIVRADPGALSPAELTEVHNDVYQSALRLHRTLRNYLLILELQQATCQKDTPPLPAAQVEGAIRTGMTEALRHHARKEDVTLDVRPCPLAIKPADLTHIVEELIDNACKFSRQTTPIRIELNPAGQLIITDQGRGLTEEEIGRLGAFQQIDREKHAQQGLGLGLMLVRKLTALYGAQFQLTGEPGKGARAEVTFPHPA